MCCGLAACNDSSLLKVLDCTAYFEGAPYVKEKVCNIKGDYSGYSLIFGFHFCVHATVL
jgi:hypothetical protein